MADETSVVIDVSDLLPGHTRAVEAVGRKLLICNAAGEFFAISASCSHAAYPLADGRLKGFELECPLHGAKFDVRDGRATRRPAIRPLATYPVEIAAGRATIRIAPD